MDGGGNGPHGENGAAFLDAHGRVERAVPFWQQLSLEERQEMLTIPLEELRRELEDEAEAAACAALKHTRGNGSSNTNGSSSGSSMVQDSHDVVFEDDGTYEMGPAYLKAELEKTRTQAAEMATASTQAPKSSQKSQGSGSAKKVRERAEDSNLDDTDESEMSSSSVEDPYFPSQEGALELQDYELPTSGSESSMKDDE